MVHRASPRFPWPIMLSHVPSRFYVQLPHGSLRFRPFLHVSRILIICAGHPEPMVPELLFVGGCIGGAKAGSFFPDAILPRS